MIVPSFFIVIDALPVVSVIESAAVIESVLPTLIDWAPLIVTLSSLLRSRFGRRRS